MKPITKVNNGFEDIRTLLAPQYNLTSDLDGEPAEASRSEASTRLQHSARERPDGESDKGLGITSGFQMEPKALFLALLKRAELGRVAGN